MHLPQTLKDAIERFCEKISLSELQAARRQVSSSYKEAQNSKAIFDDPIKLYSYLITRMPATFAACKAALQQLPEAPKTVLDLGAGPGTASWAVLDLFGKIDEYYLLEREKTIIEIGKNLAKGSDLESATWIQGDVSNWKQFPKVDLAILSYVIAEVGVDAILWNLLFEAANSIVIVEPGTPEGYKRIIQIRNRLIDLGANVIAPCPHQMACPMKSGDWCHFGARVERSRMHRLLKEAQLGFEDEKFSYLIVGKENDFAKDRVLDPIEMGHGFIKLRLCTKEGSIEQKSILKKDKDTYRKAKKLSWGDVFF